MSFPASLIGKDLDLSCYGLDHLDEGSHYATVSMYMMLLVILSCNKIITLHLTNVAI